MIEIVYLLLRALLLQYSSTWETKLEVRKFPNVLMVLEPQELNRWWDVSFIKLTA